MSKDKKIKRGKMKRARGVWGKNGDISIDELLYWAIFLAILFLVGVAIYFLFIRGSGAIDYFKNLF